MQLFMALFFYLRIVRHAIIENNNTDHMNKTHNTQKKNPWDALMNHPFNEYEW